MALIVKLNSVSAPGAPALKRDSMLNAGTRFIFDFKRAFTWPSQGTPVLNDIFYNLAEPAPSGQKTATVDINTNPLAYDSGTGALTFSGSGDTEHARLNLGNGYSLHDSECKQFLLIAWIKLPSTVVFSSSRPILALTPNGHNEALYSLHWTCPTTDDVFTLSAKSQVTGTSGQAVQVDHTSFPVGQVVQVGWHLDRETTPGSSRGTMFINGQQHSFWVRTGDAWPDRSANNLLIGSNIPGFSRSARHSLYRVLLEDLSLSGASASAQVAADYAANVGRFS